MPVQIIEDGAGLTNQFLETYVAGSDPAATNSSAQISPVVIQNQMATNPVLIPEYSVVRLEWTVFDVPKPLLAASVSNSVQTLAWTGLTNVTYAVQGAGTLVDSWATLGKVSNNRTNFAFTNWSTGTLRFYRLLVP